MQSQTEVSLRTSSGIAYTVWPHNQGAPVLFVHGHLGDRWTLRRAFEPLIGSRPVATLDLPYHGASTPAPEEDARYGGKAILEVLDALDWPTCFAVAHSAGCHALLFAALEEPERFVRQLYVGPAGDVGEQERLRFNAYIDLIGAQGFSDEIVDIALGLWYTPDYVARTPTAVATLAEQLRRNDPAMAIRMFRAFVASPPLLPLAERCRVPVDALVMRQDAAVPTEWSAPFLAALRACVRELDGGHVPFDEDPAAFGREMTRFLEA
jgi:pimeloyl-ACP methyl ester carboxylesterase